MQKTQMRGGEPQEIKNLINPGEFDFKKGRGKKAPKPPWARFKLSVEWKDGNTWTGPSLDYLPRADLRNDPSIIRTLDELNGYNALKDCIRERYTKIKKCKIWVSTGDTYALPPARNHNICVLSWTNRDGFKPMIRPLKWIPLHKKEEILKPVRALIEYKLDLDHVAQYPEGSINPKEFWY